MHEILFRGKRTDTGKWIYGQLARYNLRFDVANMVDEHEMLVPVLTKTIGQFTGLTDKNDKKIFEGDVVAQNWYDHDEPSDDSFGEVVFCEYDCSFSVLDVQKDGIVPLGRCHAYHWEVEVIGDIHDNSELLENQ